MSTRHSNDYLVGLVREFCKYPRETEWVEFKRNNADPQQIGKNISALANSAALEGKPFAYVVWGIRDEDHVIEGTSFDPRNARVGQEELESWVLRQRQDSRLKKTLAQRRGKGLRSERYESTSFAYARRHSVGRGLRDDLPSGWH